MIGLLKLIEGDHSMLTNRLESTGFSSDFRSNSCMKLPMRGSRFGSCYMGTAISLQGEDLAQKPLLIIVSESPDAKRTASKIAKPVCNRPSHPVRSKSDVGTCLLQVNPICLHRSKIFTGWMRVPPPLAINGKSCPCNHLQPHEFQICTCS